MPIDLNDPAIKAAIQEAAAAEIKALANNKNDILNEKRKLTEQLAAFEGIDPDEFKAMKAAAEKAKIASAETPDDWNSILEAREAKHSAQIAKITKELTARSEKAESRLNDMIITNELATAMQAAEIEPHFHEAVKHMLKGKFTVDSEGNCGVIADDGTAEMIPAKAYVDHWTTTTTGRPFTVGNNPNKGGSDYQVGEGVNPWKHAQRNLTKQGEIMHNSPALAKTLMKEAGVTIPANLTAENSDLSHRSQSYSRF